MGSSSAMSSPRVTTDSSRSAQSVNRNRSRQSKLLPNRCLTTGQTQVFRRAKTLQFSTNTASTPKLYYTITSMQKRWRKTCRSLQPLRTRRRASESSQLRRTRISLREMAAEMRPCLNINSQRHSKKLRFITTSITLETCRCLCIHKDSNSRFRSHRQLSSSSGLEPSLK